MMPKPSNASPALPAMVPLTPVAATVAGLRFCDVLNTWRDDRLAIRLDLDRAVASNALSLRLRARRRRAKQDRTE